jgi:hypothetical protein
MILSASAFYCPTYNWSKNSFSGETLTSPRARVRKKFEKSSKNSASCVRDSNNWNSFYCPTSDFQLVEKLIFRRNAQEPEFEKKFEKSSKNSYQQVVSEIATIGTLFTVRLPASNCTQCTFWPIFVQSKKLILKINFVTP